MIYVATNGDTWDSIAFKTLGDEFAFESLIQLNYDLCDIVQFLGGENVYISDDLYTTYRSEGSNKTQINIIKAPWG